MGENILLILCPSPPPTCSSQHHPSFPQVAEGSHSSHPRERGEWGVWQYRRWLPSRGTLRRGFCLDLCTYRSTTSRLYVGYWHQVIWNLLKRAASVKQVQCILTLFYPRLCREKIQRRNKE